MLQKVNYKGECQMDVKIELTINDTDKEVFELYVEDQQSLNDILWEVRLAIKERLYD